VFSRSRFEFLFFDDGFDESHSSTIPTDFVTAREMSISFSIIEMQVGMGWPPLGMITVREMFNWFARC
jgi:hypothetical protein